MMKSIHTHRLIVSSVVITAFSLTTLLTPSALHATTSSIPMLTGRAIYLYNQNKIDLSLAEWHKILSMDPQHQLAQEYMKKIEQQKKAKKSVSKTAVSTDKLRPVVYNPVEVLVDKNETLGLEYFASKQYKESQGRWHAILNKYPENTKIRKYLALTYFKDQKYDHALQQFLTIQKQDPDDQDANKYVDLLSNSTYTELEEAASKISLPKPERKKITQKTQPILRFDGFETTLMLSGYSTDRTTFDEDTLAFDQQVKIKTLLDGYPLHFEAADTLYWNHPDTLVGIEEVPGGIGSVDNEDYEANYRFRKMSMKYYGKDIQLLVGDIHTHYLFSKNPSHYIYQGIDYRGVNILVELEKLRAKFLWGFIPFYEPRKNIDGGPRRGSVNRMIATGESVKYSRDYFYPREVLGFDLQYEFHPQYVMGAIFTHTEDHRRIRKISDRFPMVDNYMIAINHSINIFPGKRVDVRTPKPEYKENDLKHNVDEYLAYMISNFKWYIFYETDYSWNKEDFNDNIIETQTYYSNEDVLPSDIHLNDWASYLRSEMALPHFHNEFVYQFVGPDFRNPAGFTYAQTATYDREYYKSISYFYPRDDLNFTWNASKMRSDLNHSPYIAKKDWSASKLNMRWLPGGWIPDISMDWNWENYKNSSAVTEYAPKDWVIGSYCFGMSKNILDWDLFTQYKLTVSEDGNDVFDDTYTNFFSVEAFKTLAQGIDFSVGHFFTDKDANEPSPAWDYDRDYIHTDVTLSFDLWDTSSLSFFYSYLIDTDGFDDPTQAKVHSASTTFNWPIYITTKNNHRIDMYPYITCMINESGRRNFDNFIVEPTFRFKYEINRNQYFNLHSSYRHDSGYEDEFRFYMYLTFNLEMDHLDRESID